MSGRGIHRVARCHRAPLPHCLQHSIQNRWGEQWFSITVDKYEFKLLQFCLYLFTLLINFLQPIINVKLFFLAMSLGLLKREFHSLQDRCRATILGHLSHKEQIDELKLPQRIKLFIYEGLDNFQDDVTHNISQSN